MQAYRLAHPRKAMSKRSITAKYSQGIRLRNVSVVAAGLLLTVTLATIGISYAADARARVYAWNSTVWGVTSVAGPSDTDVVSHSSSWRPVSSATA